MVKRYNPRQNPSINQNANKEVTGTDDEKLPLQSTVELVEEISLQDQKSEVEQEPIVKRKQQSNAETPKVEAKKEKQIPVYSVERELGTRSVLINAINVSEIETKNSSVDRFSLIKEMLLNIEKEIERTKIEIEIHEHLSGILSGEKWHMNVRRIDSYQKSLEYLILKKETLEKIKTNGGQK